MFQNLTDSIEEQEINNSKFKLIAKELLTVPNIIICVLTLLMSTLSIENEVIPFGLAMVAATLSQGFPIIGVLISAAIGTLVGNGIAAFLGFAITEVIYFALVLIFKSKVAIEERNELLKTGKKLFLACFIVSFFKNVKGQVLTYDIFMALVSSALTYVFYKIFVNGLVVIRNFKEKRAYTLEEIIGATIIVSIASMVFSNSQIFGIHINNVIIIFFIMLLGWKNGMVVGCTAGLSMGLVVSMIQLQDGMQMAVFAVAGIVAGLLNKFGRIGVIVGFIFGNSLLIYLTNGDTLRLIYFREIFIASVALLFVPSKVKIDIENIVSGNKLLSDIGENRLNQSEEFINKLNNISDTIANLVDEKVETIDDVKEEFKDRLFENLEEISNNMFYEEVINEDSGISDEIYVVLQKNDIILENDVIGILKNHNNYIIMQDQNIKNDLQELIKIINRSYKMVQIEITRLQERNKNRKSIKKGLKDVSDAINNVVKNDVEKKNSKFANKEKEISIILKNKYSSLISTSITQNKNEKYIIKIAFSNDKVKDKQYISNISNILTKSLGNKIVFQRDYASEKYTQVYMSEDKFVLQVGSSKVSKDGSNVSGDCSLQMKLEDGKYLLAISDGMGTGRKARESSKLAINMLEKMLVHGFDENDLMNFINDSLNFNTDSEMYATLDFSILDLYTGKMKIAKSCASNTYIKNKKNIKVITSSTTPVGILDKIEFKVSEIEVSDGDIIVMCSDGVLDSQNELGKDWIEEYLRNISTTNVQKVADLIVAEAIDNSFGIARDDMTVIVAKVVKKK